MVKSLLRSGVSQLGWHQRDFLMRAMVTEYGHQDWLVRMAEEAGIVGFIVSGRQGRIQSAIADRRILLDYARTGSWAEHTVAAFERFFAGQTGTYLDIGANIGLTTIPVARMPGVRCIAFEPDPTNFANLTDNIRRNAAGGDVALHQVALFDKPGSLSFTRSEHGNLGDHRVTTAANAAPERTIQVPAARLDDMVACPSGALAIKLDAQGAEPFIIAGGQQVLRQCGLAVVEFSPMLIDQLGGDVALVIDFLASFDRFEIGQDDTGQPPSALPAAAVRGHLEAAFQRGRTNDRDYLDVYAWRGAAT